MEGGRLMWAMMRLAASCEFGLREVGTSKVLCAIMAFDVWT